MQDRDLIVGVLAAQAGFVTPAQVLAAAAEALLDPASGSLLARLQQSGSLNVARRKLLDELAGEALQKREAAVSRGGEKLLESLSGGTVDAGAGAMPDVPLERPGQYTRLHELGRGGQSVVRAARDEIIGREVALKELSPRSVDPAEPFVSRAAQARFLREARLVAGLNHPGIVAVHELARRSDGTLFCAQKLVRGETLQARLVACRTLAERLGLLRHVVDACEAVAYAHAKGIIHRDLKPSNIMVGEYGETVVVDWGLAKRREEPDEAVPLQASPAAEPDLTVAGMALGTPTYMSPEQARGDLPAIDARSDVYSLGAILYQVLTGRPPFEGATAEHIIEKVRVGRLVNVQTLSPEAPRELAAIAERALSFQPAGRYQDAAALAKELATFLAGGRVGAYRYGTWQLVRKYVAGHRALATGVAVAMVALAVSAVVAGFRLRAARRELASSFIERAYAGEREGDWTSAAAYFAAARVQNDTPEARWGVALAGERATERILTRRAAPDTFADVGVLPDGRIVTLGVAPNQITMRDAESGATLWSAATPVVNAAALLPGGWVRLSLPDGWAFYDAATGAKRRAYDAKTDGRPCPGPYPTQVVQLGTELWYRPEEGAPRRIATDTIGTRCTVSDDRRLVAFHDNASRIVHVMRLEDGRVIASRPAEGLRGPILYSRHGFVILAQARMEVIGGPDGDFAIELPETGLGLSPVGFGAERMSVDGNLVVVARLGSNRADVFDLRSRSIRATLHYGPGWPRFAFSLDGERVYAAGLEQGAALTGWRLPPASLVTAHAGNHVKPTFSPDGGELVVVSEEKTAPYELYDADGRLRATGAHFDSLDTMMLSNVGSLLASCNQTGDGVVLHDLARDQIAWEHATSAQCSYVTASADGSRLGWVGFGGLSVWDTRANRPLFEDPARVAGLERTRTALSPDGRRIAWTLGTTAIVRDLDGGQERTLPLDGLTRGVQFSPQSESLAVLTTGSLTVWDAATGRVRWSAVSPVPVYSLLSWAADGRALLLRYDALGTDLVDADTGAHLTRFMPGSRFDTLTELDIQPDLRAEVVSTPTHWEHRPLPSPVSEPPEAGLARVLQRSGLALRGIDVVAAP